MKRAFLLSIGLCLCITVSVFADTFGTGDNQFEIEFVTISGDASGANGSISGMNKPEGFIDPAHNYRIGTYEITAEQWTKFNTAYGIVTGNPSTAYDANPTTTGMQPVNSVSWYEAIQFVNWLNTSTGHQAAYKCNGTQGTNSYAFTPWDTADLGYDASNPYRNSNAFYFLPTEDEWMKAAYWNGTSLQTYASIDNSVPIPGVDTNYGFTFNAPWNVGSGSEELNGTYDMMGNVWELMETPYVSGYYFIGTSRGVHGGGYDISDSFALKSSTHSSSGADQEYISLGFRVASVVPEPATVVLFGLGGLVLRRRK